MSKFDEFMYQITDSGADDYNSFHLSSTMRDFLDLGIEDYSCTTFKMDEETIQLLYKIKDSEPPKDDLQRIFRDGYNREHYLSEMGMPVNIDNIRDLLVSIMDIAEKEGYININAIRMLSYPLMGHNTDVVISHVDQVKNSFAGAAVEDIYRSIGEDEYYEKWLAGSEKFFRERYQAERMTVRDLLYECWKSFYELKDYGKKTVRFDVMKNSSYSWNVGASEVRLWDEDSFGKSDPESMLSTRATWIVDLIAYIPLKYSGNKRFSKRPIPNYQDDRTPQEWIDEFEKEKGQDRNIYILTEGGKAYSDEGCEYITETIRNRINDPCNFVFLMGDNYNDPEELSRELFLHPRSYVVISRKTEITTLSGDAIGILRDQLEETIGMTSWQIACQVADAMKNKF